MSIICLLIVLSDREIFLISAAAASQKKIFAIVMHAGNINDSAIVCGFICLAMISATAKLAWFAFWLMLNFLSNAPACFEVDSFSL